jgi:hypothetical protein
MGEGRGEGESKDISMNYIARPLIPARRGRRKNILYDFSEIGVIEFHGIVDSPEWRSGLSIYRQIRPTTLIISEK